MHVFCQLRGNYKIILSIPALLFNLLILLNIMTTKLINVSNCFMLFPSIDSFIVEITSNICIARIMNFSVKILIVIVYFNIILFYKTIIKQSVANELCNKIIKNVMT